MIILEMLSYPFLARAMLVGVLVSLCSALLGTPLVLKRYSMIGDGLSHVGFGALAIASAFRLGAARRGGAGGRRVRRRAPAREPEPQRHKGRRRGRAHILGRARRGRAGHKPHERREHQRLELYVRLHPHRLALRRLR